MNTAENARFYLLAGPMATDTFSDRSAVTSHLVERRGPRSSTALDPRLAPRRWPLRRGPRGVARDSCTVAR